jgi:hypothetical protein
LGRSVPVSSKPKSDLQECTFQTRLEFIFPHRRYQKDVICKEQEAYTIAISIVDEYLLDFHIAANKISLTMIPALRKWMQTLIYEKIKHLVLWPNQIRLCGPADHLHTSQGCPMEPLDLQHAESLPSETIGNPYVTGISLFFPEGESSSPPEGFELIDRTCTGSYAANLNSGSSAARAVYLCINKSTSGPAITDIGGIKASQFEQGTMPEGYRAIRISHFGEDAFISESSTGDQGSRLYISYEKADPRKGIIEDVKVMFGEEVSKVRELKARWLDIGTEDFPLGYTILRLHTVPQDEAGKPPKSIFLCFKRRGGTILRPLDRGENQSEKGASLRSALTSIKTIAAQEIQQISHARSKKRQTRKITALGVPIGLLMQ